MDDKEIKQAEEDYQMNPAVPERVPGSTFWPLASAIAVMFFFWGILTTWILSAVGIVIFIFSAGGWISDLNHENMKDEKRED